MPFPLLLGLPAPPLLPPRAGPRVHPAPIPCMSLCAEVAPSPPPPRLPSGNQSPQRRDLAGRAGNERHRASVSEQCGRRLQPGRSPADGRCGPLTLAVRCLPATPRPQHEVGLLPSFLFFSNEEAPLRETVTCKSHTTFHSHFTPKPHLATPQQKPNTCAALGRGL